MDTKYRPAFDAFCAAVEVAERGDAEGSCALRISHGLWVVLHEGGRYTMVTVHGEEALPAQIIATAAMGYRGGGPGSNRPGRL